MSTISFLQLADLEKLGSCVAPGKQASVVENESSLLSTRDVEVAVQPGATLRWFLFTAGEETRGVSRRFLFQLHEGARLELFGAFAGHHDQQLKFDVRIEHLAPRTTSHAEFRGALWGSARAELREQIHMSPEAKEADGRVDGHVLMLSRDAVANVVPDLEIEQQNVRASHGATIGRVSPEQIFYLATRGMDPAGAEQLIVEGFFRDIFSKFPIDKQGNIPQFISSLSSDEYTHHPLSPR